MITVKKRRISWVAMMLVVIVTMLPVAGSMVGAANSQPRIDPNKPRPDPAVVQNQILTAQTINGSPLKLVVNDNTSTAIYYNGVQQYYGGNAEGAYLWYNGLVYGPMPTVPAGNAVNAWNTVSNILTGSGTSADPWKVTTVVTIPSVSLTQTVAYVNGNSYAAYTFVVNAPTGSTWSLFHAADLYTDGNDVGYPYYNASTGDIGGRNAVTNFYQYFRPITPASAYQEAFYKTIWNQIGSTAGPGPGFNDTTDPGLIDNGAGLQWNRGGSTTINDWAAFGDIIGGCNTPTSTPTRTATNTPTRTATATATNTFVPPTSTGTATQVLATATRIVTAVSTIIPASPNKPRPDPAVVQNQILTAQTINGSPLKLVVNDNTSTAIYYNGVQQYYGGNAEGAYLWYNGLVYGPMPTVPAGNAVNPWNTVSNILTGSGTNADPWKVTTVVTIPSVSLTQTVAYVNGNSYAAYTFVVNAPTGSTWSLFHAADLYTDGNDVGYPYYNASTGDIGGRNAVTNFYQYFRPITPASAYQEAFYKTIWNQIGSTAGPGPGFNDTTDPGLIDNGAGLQWNRGGSTTINDWAAFGDIIGATDTPTPTPTLTPTPGCTPTPTSTLTNTPTSTPTSTPGCGPLTATPTSPYDADKPAPDPVIVRNQALTAQTINGSPLRITVNDNTSTAIYYNNVQQYYGGNAEGAYLWYNGLVYGPMPTVPAGNAVNAWNTVSNILTGSGTNADPWKVTTVVTIPSVSLTQTVAYVNGNSYAAYTFVVNAPTGSTWSLFHAADLYTDGNDVGYPYYNASTGDIGGRNATTNFYQYFRPITPASAYQEAFYKTIWNQIGSTAGPGPGFNDTTDPNLIDNGAGLQWNRGGSTTINDWAAFGAIIGCGTVTATPSSTATPTHSTTNTPTYTPTNTPTPAPTATCLPIADDEQHPAPIAGAAPARATAICATTR